MQSLEVEDTISYNSAINISWFLILVIANRHYSDNKHKRYTGQGREEKRESP